MSLQKFLKENKPVILRRWFNAILDTYPSDTKQFLQTKKNQFDNPVAHRISRGMEGIFSQIIGEAEENDVSPFLDKVIRVRAVQDFTPSQAVAFIFALKRLVREELGEKIREAQLSEELWRFEEEIDKMGLLALDIYMKCREEIYEVRVREVKRSVGRLIERANKICGIPPKQGDLEPGSTDNLF